jgi:coniferyl-aldehyde dehydrogenase
LTEGLPAHPLAPGGDSRRRAISLVEAPPDSALAREEIFGPVLALSPQPDLTSAIAWIAERPPPLAVYLFGASELEEEAVVAGTRSGAVVSGRAVEYVAFPSLGFGGVGASGHGRYHGLRGFEEFSHLRAIVKHGRWSLSRLFDQPRRRIAQRLISRLAKNS